MPAYKDSKENTWYVLRWADESVLHAALIPSRKRESAHVAGRHLLRRLHIFAFTNLLLMSERPLFRLLR